jgi:hypothetical protein
VKLFVRLLFLFAFSFTVISTPPTSAQAESVCSFKNRTVKPGLVHWHKNFDDACAASKSSGKPVILFQMLGHLDQEFC